MSAVDFLVVFTTSASAMAVLQYLKRRPSTRYRVYAHRCGVCGRWHYER